MNSQTTDLLQKLADKLGTTAQQLWAVLIHQAPIAATIDLIQIVVLAIVTIIFYKAIRKLDKKSNDRNADFEWGDSLGVAVFFVLAAIIIFIAWCIFFSSLNEIINGYFNPDYWALNQIFDAIKQSK